MDITLIDVTAVADVKVGDLVILLGSSDHCGVSAWDHAALENTVPYEVLCRIGRRVVRNYVE
jgi:alanine racemase